MIAYYTQERNPDNETLPNECPWVSWFYNEGDPLPDNAIVVTDEEYQAIYASFEMQILKEKDRVTMLNRAKVKDTIIGEIGADNKERIRLGLWSVSDLVGLTQDPTFMAILNDIQGLSFELAQQKIMAWTHPLITQEIKMGIIIKLQGNLFL